VPQTHQQQDARPARGPRQRALADLCRQQPAVWSWIVRYADHLESRGWQPNDAVDAAATIVGLKLPTADTIDGTEPNPPLGSRR
jgi:hypothetical protein